MTKRKVVKRKIAQPNTNVVSVWDIFGNEQFSFITTKGKSVLYSSATRGVVIFPRTECVMHESDWPLRSRVELATTIYRATHVAIKMPRPLSIITSAATTRQCAMYMIDEFWQSGYSPTSFALGHYSIDPNGITFWAYNTIVSRNSIAVNQYKRTKIKTMSLLPIASSDERRLHLQSENAFDFFEAVINCLADIGNLLGSNSDPHTCRNCMCASPKICELCFNIMSDCKIELTYSLPFAIIKSTLSSLFDIQ